MYAAFEELKVKLTSAPVLAYHDNDRTCMVCIDASSKAVSAVLRQAYENSQDDPIDYGSSALSPAESHYYSFKRKALGVVFELKRIRYYITQN